MPNHLSGSEVTAEEVRAQLERILSSKVFARSKRQSDFISYVVIAALEGRSDRLKEFTLGIDVFERDDSFDPKIDSIVRVEASRLRSKLREYYQEDGASDPLRIEIPKGHYVPVFRLLELPKNKINDAVPGPILTRQLVIALAAILAVAIIFVAVVRNSDRGARPGGVESALTVSDVPTADLDKTIAVLPFRNLSNAADDVYFVDGVHDDILTQLEKLSSLDKVISRTSMEQYRNTAKTMVAIGEELGVAVVLEGSVQRVGDRVRINAQLISAAADKHIWAETYDRELTTSNIFAIQSEIAKSIANELDTTLSPEEQRALDEVPTENLQAYELFQRAQLVRRTLGLGSRSQVAVLLEQAVSLDPNFAQAHVVLARAYIDRYFTNERDVSQRTLARAALDTALELSPDLPEAHIALADYYYKGFLDYDRAIEQLNLAIALAPGNAQAHAIRAFVRRRRGDIEGAIPDLERAIELDPGNFSPHYVLADTFVILGQYDRSIAHYDKALELAPQNFGLKILKAYALTSSDIDLSAMRDLTGDPAFSDGSSTVEILYRWKIALSLGNYDLSMSVIESHGSESVVRQTAYYPLDLMRALTEFYIGDENKAPGYFQSAKSTLDTQIQVTPEDPRLYSAIGFAHAGLGNRDQAIEAATIAYQLYPASRDAVDGPLYVLNFAKTHAMLGEHDETVARLKELLSKPRNFYATPNALLIEPAFAELRDDQAFVSLIEKYR